MTCQKCNHGQVVVSGDDPNVRKRDCGDCGGTGEVGAPLCWCGKEVSSHLAWVVDESDQRLAHRRYIGPKCYDYYRLTDRLLCEKLEVLS